MHMPLGGSFQYPEGGPLVESHRKGPSPGMLLGTSEPVPIAFPSLLSIRPSMVTAPPGWRISDDGKRMSLELRTKDFLSALELFRAIGEIAEELEHHPDLHLEEWNRVRIVTWSHDVGGLTERDEGLAGRIGAMVKERGHGE